MSRILKLNRALYGLRNAPKIWNNKFNKMMLSYGFERSNYDFCFYHKEYVYLVLFVDDAIIAGSELEVQRLLKDLNKELKVKITENVNSFLGMQINEIENGLHVSQTKLINKLLEDFNMLECKSVSVPMVMNFFIEDGKINHEVPYRKLICSLMYIAVTTRPDLSFSVTYLSRYLDNPTDQAWKAGKRILRYLSSTKNIGLYYKKGENIIEGFCDADWGGDKETRKSVSGLVVLYAGNPVAWHSKKQTCVALSSMEAEYISAGSAVQEVINLKGILSEFNLGSNAVLKIDNLSAISMINTFENSKRAKHIDIKYHYIKDLYFKKKFNVECVSSDNNVSDLLTKPLGKQQFVKFRTNLLH